MNSTDVSANSNWDLVAKTLQIINAAFRVYGLLVQVLFCAILVASNKLHNREHLFINHARFANSFVVVLLFVDMFIDVSPGADPTLCSAFDLLWSFATYIRMYSIVLIALYRYFGVFRLKFYKKINQSVKYFAGPIALVWLLSILMPVVFKYSSHTRNIYDNCDDTVPPNVVSVVLYFCLDYSLQILLPTVAISVLYAIIMHKIEENHKKLVENTSVEEAGIFHLDLAKLHFPIHLNHQEENHHHHHHQHGHHHHHHHHHRDHEHAHQANQVEPDHHHHHQHRHHHTTSQVGLNVFAVYQNTHGAHRHHLPSLRDLNTKTVLRQNATKNQRRFAIQLILMCGSVVVSSVCLSVFSMRYVIADYVSSFRYWDPILQIVMMLAISVVPVIGIYYHPARASIIKKFRLRKTENASTAVSRSYSVSVINKNSFVYNNPAMVSQNR